MSRSGRPDPDKAPPSHDSTRQLLFTLDAATHQVIKVETVTRTGAHRELSERQSAELMGDDDLDSLESAIDEAYEAGVAEGLGEAENAEDDEELALEQLLIDPGVELQLLQRGIGRLLVRKVLLRRLLRRRLARPVTTSGPPVHQARNGSAAGV